MSHIPPLKAKIIVNALLKAGFYIHHQTGSHVQLQHRVKIHLRVTIARHDRFDLPSFVVRNILKQAGVSEKDFLKLL
ncbi:hypothetical protein A3A21_03305 [Candidatus Jorgensenbacteria bacterium RIFCSPLOWO2_01_FULL_45_25b]|uniref:Addiction module toxin, HicA family n=1 Tax=Candidatus Jorgensenbacteria bacterium RIFCSPLOWO2_01_FULL_45_25b TaxID=1798471 RepID=A0A1F6BTE6_9BACT|nr:MAG: hypothetical protein A3A21_03305 [Candidatus Jorgensenbacteria bacterium RIFCSPLOWO2_01_FULL_45_25b]